MIGVLNIVVLEDQVKYRSFAKAIKALLDEDTLISISYFFIFRLFLNNTGSGIQQVDLSFARH